MLTPMSIMSLDQGKEFARQEMKHYAEPKEPALENMLQEAAVGAARSIETVRKPGWRSLLSELVELWEAGHPVGAKRF